MWRDYSKSTVQNIGIFQWWPCCSCLSICTNSVQMPNLLPYMYWQHRNCYKVLTHDTVCCGRSSSTYCLGIQVWRGLLFVPLSLLRLFFNAIHGGSTFFRNVGELLPTTRRHRLEDKSSLHHKFASTNIYIHTYIFTYSQFTGMSEMEVSYMRKENKKLMKQKKRRIKMNT
jgi:hypothetical protein